MPQAKGEIKVSDNLNQNVGVQFTPHPQISDYSMPGFKYYHSMQSDMRMIRPDGKHITFRHNFFETDQSGDQDYLDEEIHKHKNMFVRIANPDEVRVAHYRRDPKAVIIEDIKNDPNVMAELRAEIEKKVRAEMLGDADKIAGTSGGGSKAEVIETGSAKVILDSKQKLRDLGNHIQEKLVPSSTASIAGNTVDSTSKP